MRERLTTEDADTITPQTIINIRPVVAALKEFFGSSQLASSWTRRTRSPGLTHRRRLSRPRRRRPDARARADRGARRAPDPLRPHVPDRDAGGPEHRPDRLAVDATREVSEHGFVTTPYRVVKDGKVTDEIVHLDATAGAGAPDRPGQRRRSTRTASCTGDEILCRTQAGQYVYVAPEGGRPDRRLARADLVGRDGDDPVPRARRRQPRADGLEHAAPGGAAAQDRRAAGRHRAWSAARRSTPATCCWPRNAGTVDFVDADADRRRPSDDGQRRVRAAEVHALQPGHADPPEAARQGRPEGQGRATCSPTAPRPTTARWRSART